MIHYGRDCPLGDPADDYDPFEDERAEYDAWELDLEPHPGVLFPALADETEAALRAADEFVEALEQDDGDDPFEPSDYTPDPPTMAERWPPAERAELERRLRRMGSNIGELSDVRSICGLPRLSESTAEQRRYAHHLLSTRRGREALEAVRREREALRESAGLSKSRAARMRLGELRDAARRAA